MVLPLKIALRFLRTSPVQSALIATGIAVGIATQVFVGSLITSLQASLVEQTIGSTPHVIVRAPDEAEPLKVTAAMLGVVQTDPRVEPGAVVPVRVTNALLTDGDNSATLALKGGDLGGLDAIYRLRERTVASTVRLGKGDVVIGTTLAEKFSLAPGDSVALTLPDGSRRTLRVTAVVDLGAEAANERQAFVDADLPRSVLGWRSDEFAAIEAQILDPFDSTAVATDWRSRLRGVRVVEWQEQNADLLTALQSQASSSYMIQAFVLIAVALGIASTLAISAVQKTRQIGILKAMGMSDAQASRIFLWQAAALGLAGTAGGVALGYALLWGFSFAPVQFSIRPEPSFIALSASIGVAVSMASSIIPARRTSRVDPIEVIQGG